MFKLKKVAGSVGVALALMYAAPSSATIGTPGALGDAFLHFTDTAFAVGDGKAGASGIPLAALVGAGVLTIATTGFESATTAAVYNSVPGVSVGNGSYALGAGFTASTLVGAGFAPLGPEAPVTAGAPPLTSGGGGYSKSTGDSTIATAAVFIHSLSQLAGKGDTNASATQDLQTEFGISVGSGGAPIELTFNLERLVRAGLGQKETKSFAATSFTVTVTDISTGDDLYVWSPNGSGGLSGDCVSLALCVTFSDPFSIQNSRTVNGVIDDRAAGNAAGFFAATTQIGFFESELFLPEGDYTVSIHGTASSNASIIIPEPGSIALLGLGLLGLGLVSRRKHMA